jgi:iron complex outermembrane receptor protein
MSGPITDTLRFLIGANGTTQRGGYYTNLDGAPEGGSVAQGGNGRSYHVEGQLLWTPNDKFEWWAKAATSDYSVSFHTQTLVGEQDLREFYDPLMPNQNYGLCALPANATVPDCIGNPDTIVPGSLQTLPNTIPGNPSALHLRTFDADFWSNSREEQNLIAATTLTYHASSFDVKYLFGYQKFYYDLNAPWLYSEGVSSGVQQYTLQGPAVATPTCAATFDNAGCTQNLVVDPAYTQFTFIENEYFYSNELNISSTNNGPVQWIAGLYWYHEHYDQPINVLDPSQPQVYSPVLFAPFLSPAAPNPTGSVYNEYTELTENSYAGFAQVDWKVTSTLKFTGGVRYTYDEKDGGETFRVILFNFEDAGLGVNTFGADTPAFDATACPTSPAPPYPGAGPCTVNPATGLAVRPLDGNWNAVTGTAGLSWTPDPDTLAYAKFSRGYKTGGFNSGIVAPDPETKAELVNAYEVGLKKTIGSTFLANISAFYYDYYNDQQPLSASLDNVVTTVIFNLPVVHSYGVELESYWRPVRDLTLSLNYAYLSATIASMDGVCLEDTNDPLGIEPGAKPCPASAQISPGIVLQDITGATVPQAPKNKISLNGLYTLHFQPGNLSLSATFTWRDSAYDSVFNRYYNESPGYTQVGLRATWTGADNRYSIILFVDNLFNTVGYDGTDGIPVTNAGPDQVVSKLESLTAPRTYGVEVQYRFR